METEKVSQMAQTMANLKAYLKAVMRRLVDQMA
jgi:hypothetical protein